MFSKERDEYLVHSSLFFSKLAIHPDKP